jgi:hypothetical protein
LASSLDGNERAASSREVPEPSWLKQANQKTFGCEKRAPYPTAPNGGHTSTPLEA